MMMSLPSATSNPDKGKEYRENRVENDDQEDRLNDGAGRLLTNALRTADDFQPLEAADHGNDERKHRRFDQPDKETP